MCEYPCLACYAGEPPRFHFSPNALAAKYAKHAKEEASILSSLACLACLAAMLDLMTYDVAIIGAGAAGLAAARDCSRAGLHVVLIEARDRIGGRVHTTHDAATPVPIELGAEFIHGKPRETFDLLREANQSAYDLPDTHRHLRGNALEEIDFWGVTATVLDKLDPKTTPDEPFATFAERFRDENAQAVDLALAYVEGFNAARADRISARGLAVAEAKEHDDALLRPTQAYGAMLDALWRQCEVSGAELRLSTIVTAISWTPGSVEIATQANQTTRAPKAVITLPLGVLKAGGVCFDPPLVEKEQAASKLEVGPVVRVVLRFREPFWETEPFSTVPRGQTLEDLNFLHGPTEVFPTWWTQLPMRVPLLVGWSGGPAAERLADKSDHEILAAALGALCRMLGTTESFLRERLAASYVADWHADPFARGAYSYVPVGGLDAMKQLAQSLESTLFFAGEATHHEGQSGTVSAALATGYRAAREVIGH